MTSEPLAPGAPAVILYREVQREDCGVTCHSENVGLMSVDRFEEDYFRIKILTDAGRKYGEVEIPLSSDVGTVDNVKARTIQPDGSIVNFNGQVYEKNIVKARGFQYKAKTFAMPNVQMGSIIEYYYTVNFLKGFFIFGSNWVLSQELFTKQAKFTLRPFQSSYYPMSFQWREHLSAGTPSPKQQPDGTVVLEASNIAAFQAEDFMPPENELKSRVDFTYSADPFENDPAKFWKKVGKKRNEQLESFVSKRGAMEQAVGQIVASGDAPEEKLRKIYGRVQKLRNTSYEPVKTDQEVRRENSKVEVSVEDIWKRGAGDSFQITWLFLALARAAGFEAYGVWVSDRSNYFFDPLEMNTYSLSTNIVLVKLNGSDVYLDPGAPYAPFGLLPWEKTGVPGLRLDKDGGTWIQTSLSDSAASRVERKADFKLTQNGSLEGTLVLSYTGLEALRLRIDERNQDATARKQFLENEVRQFVPAATEVEMTKAPEWTSSESPLAAEFTVKIPGWCAPAGRRALFPMGIFSAPEKHVFEYSVRVHPIYFDFKSERTDDISVAIPLGWQITNLPAPQTHDLHAVAYTASAENSSGKLHLTRKLAINNVSIDTKYYAPLRNFYQGVRAADEQVVVLVPGVATAGQ